MKPGGILIVLLFLFKLAVAQDCSCRELLDSAIIKTELNYAGYQHKINAANRSAYTTFKKGLIKQASTTSFIDCYSILNRYVSYFNDGHLFIVEFPRVTVVQSDSLSKIHPRYSSSQQNSKMKTDMIVGTWQSAKEQLEIVPVSDNIFHAVVKKTSTPKWEPGMIKMEISKTDDNKYQIKYYNTDFTFSRFADVGIFKRLLLGFGMNKYVKLDATDPESQYIHTNNPELPYFKVIDKDNILLTIPSALINNKIVDSILKANYQLITSTKNFIIDLRSNIGGNYMWGGIQMVANTKEYADKKEKQKDDFLMLASSDNAAYFENYKNFMNGDTAGIGYYARLTEKIKGNLGNTIGFSFYDTRPQDTSKQIVFRMPQNIAVIIDKAVASAAEAVVQSLKTNSTKVTIYGENSYGMIDYVNVNTVRLKRLCTQRYYFGYPTFYSPDMLKNPVNPTGIKPDIYISRTNKNWIDWVVDDLRKKK